jgi:hypothetical protein
MPALTTIAKYWPAVVAVLYVAYTAASGKTDQLPAALAALMAALGYGKAAAAQTAAQDARSAASAARLETTLTRSHTAALVACAAGKQQSATNGPAKS